MSLQDLNSIIQVTTMDEISQNAVHRDLIALNLPQKD